MKNIFISSLAAMSLSLIVISTQLVASETSTPSKVEKPASTTDANATSGLGVGKCGTGMQGKCGAGKCGTKIKAEGMKCGTGKCGSAKEAAGK